MKRDARLKRSGERTDRWLGGQHRRPRYYPCPMHHSSVVARIARGLRIPVGILGLGLPGVRYAVQQAYEREYAKAVAQRIASTDAPSLTLGPARVTWQTDPELERHYPRWIGAQVQEL